MLNRRVTAGLQSAKAWAARKPRVMRLAAQLGRGRGRARLLDRVISPPPAAPVRPDLSDWRGLELAAAWIGHATVLLRIGGLTVLTDPVFSNKIGIGFGLFTGGPRRLVAPALRLRDLPPVDLLLVSHAHFDHLDRPSLARLPKSAHVITSEHNGDLVRDLGFRRVDELRWGERLDVNGLSITARPVRHWGARTLYDHHRGFNAFLLEAGGRRVLYGGDTAYGEHFRDVGGVDLAILGIGAYNPWLASHASPEQVWRMAAQMGAKRVLPIHHSTFVLSHEPIEEPLARLLEAAGRDSDRVVVRQIGEMWRMNSGADLRA